MKGTQESEGIYSQQVSGSFHFVNVTSTERGDCPLGRCWGASCEGAEEPYVEIDPAVDGEEALQTAIDTVGKAGDGLREVLSVL